MPTTVNGIGTRYAGQSDLAVVQSNCPFCNRYTNLSSYTTREFFCFVYIPLIPMGRYRIVNQCAACRRHYRIPFNDYQQRVEAEIGPLRAAAERSPNDPEARVALVEGLMGYQMYAQGEETARAGIAMAPRHARLNRLLAQLMTLRGNAANATPFYRQAAESAPSDPEIRFALGRHLAGRGANAEAARELAEARRLDPGNVQILYLLGDALVAEKRWAEALDAFQQIGSINPAHAASRDLLRRMKQCKEALGFPITDAERKAGRRWWPFGGKSTPAARPLRPATSSVDGKTLCIALAALAAIGAVVFLVLGLWTQYRSAVWFDNGLDKPVRIALDKDVFEVPPGPPVSKAAAQGSHTVVVSDLQGHEIERATIQVPEIGLLDAVFAVRLFVYNVAEAHVYRREDVGYAQAEANRTYKQTFIGLQRFFEEDGVDYAFQNAPETIEVDSSSSVTDKVALNVVPIGINRLGVIWFHEGKLDDAERAFRRALDREPCAPMPWTNLLDVLENRGAPQEKVAVQARAWLEACPASIEAHRAYQDQQVALGRRAEMLAEYRLRRDALPREGASHYLYARLVNDPEQAVPLYREAVRLDPSLSWAQTALARNLLSLEQDAESMDILEKVLQTPDHDLFVVQTYAMAAIGAGTAEHADQVLEALEKQQKEDEEALWQARWLLSLALGRYDAAEVRLQERTQRTGESPANWMRRVQYLRLREDNAGLTQAIVEGRLKPETAGDAGMMRMEQALAHGNWAEAVKAIDELKPDDVSVFDRLYAAIALLQAGDRKAAGERLSALDAELSQPAANNDSSAASLAMTRHLEGKAPAAAVLASARRAGFQMLPHAYFVLASVRAAAGDATGARALYEKSRQRALGFELPYFAAAALSKG